MQLEYTLDKISAVFFGFLHWISVSKHKIYKGLSITNFIAFSKNKFKLSGLDIAERWNLFEESSIDILPTFGDPCLQKCMA